MKLDISRDTFQQLRHFSAVRLEQGRVSVDADWNEQIAINHHHTRTTARDVIGASGTPKLEPGFELVMAPDGSDVLIRPGRYYVDGILCELDTPVASVASYGPAAKQATIATWMARTFAVDQWVQAYVPGKPPIYTTVTAVDTTKGVLTLADEIKTLGAGAQLTVMGTYGTQADLAVTLGEPLFALGKSLLYLDVWEREITALDDDSIREVALNGADTATRTRVVWQLKTLHLDEASVDCSTVLPEYDALIAPPTGQIAARAKRDVTTDNPCLVPTSSGYRRLENQLYRVEIHDAGSLADGKATFKWSRENGAVVGKITGATGKVLTLAAAPRDDHMGFSPGDWVEISDDASELAGTPGTLFKVTKSEGKQITLNNTPTVDTTKNPKLRRWESAGALAVTSDPTKDDGYLRLEDGVQVEFFDGTYKTGDFWLIPARTITYDVEWPSDDDGPLPQPRKGPRHHYARLAVVTTDLEDDENVSRLEDCRHKFPPLTDITADDVSCHSDCDLLAESKTVQEALDLLCHERDLRFHNKHLHGWGIVCGLQVYCGPDSQPPEGSEVFETLHDTVTVKNGYAIDSNGNDIIVDTKDDHDVETGDYVKILDMMRDQKLLVDPQTGKFKTGSVSLWMKQGATAKDRYRLEEYNPNSESWASVFKDGFWWDVWSDCLFPIFNDFKDEFVGKDAQSWEHIISFINVLAFLLFPQHGANVYISPKEDAILREFYDKLRKRLQSKTYCAMFDGRGFPDYNKIFDPTTLDPRPSTIFGRVLQGFSIPSRMRVTPNGQLAVTLSGKLVAKDQSSILHVFDIRFKDGETLLVDTAFPTAGATVSDVSFSADSKQMYAIAILNGNDSLFATCDISDPKNPKWGTVTTLCDFPLVTLQTSLADAKKVYATARAKGLFQIDISGLAPQQLPLVPFTACGHLELAMIGTGNERKQYAFCTVGPTPTYNSVKRIDLSNNAAVDYLLPASNPAGNDDICVAVDPGKTSTLHVVANAGAGQTSKKLVRFDVSGAAATTFQFAVDLGFQPPNNNQAAVDNTIYRLAYNAMTRKVMIASFESFLIKMVTPMSNELEKLTHPTQLWPIAIAYNPLSEFAAANSNTKLTGGVFVMNALSGTINNIPAAYIGQTPQVVNLNELATYHKAVLEAFIDLFGKFAQYLKDCFCDHFLIHCPEGDVRKIYLARIDIDGEKQQIDNICNFSRRRYVHSFPTVEYWLTLVPILPVVRKLVGDWCCTLIQHHFSKINAPDPATKADKVSSSSTWNTLSFVQTLNPSKVISTQAGSKFNLAGALSKTFLSKTASQPPTPPPPPSGNANLSEVTYQPSGTATKYLADRNVTVLSKEVATGGSITETLAAPATLKPNDNVVLVTDANDVVLGYRVVKPAGTTTVAGAASNEALVAELGKRDAAIADLRGQLDVMKASNDSIRTQLDAMGKTNEAVRGQLDAMAKTHATELAARDKQLDDMNKRVTTIMGRLPPR